MVAYAEGILRGHLCAHSWAHGLEELLIDENVVVVGEDKVNDLGNMVYI